MIGKFTFCILNLLFLCAATANSLDKRDSPLLDITDSNEEQESAVDFSNNEDNIVYNIPEKYSNTFDESVLTDDDKKNLNDFSVKSFENEKTNTLFEEDNDTDSDSVEIIASESDVPDSDISVGDSDETKDMDEHNFKKKSFESVKDDDKEIENNSFSERVPDGDLEDRLKEEDNYKHFEDKIVPYADNTDTESEHPGEDSDMDFDKLTEEMNEKDQHRKNTATDNFEPIPMPTSFESYDINNDHDIDKEELIKVTGAWKNVDVVFDIIDTNGDNKISRTEFYKAPLDLSGKATEEK